MKNYFIPITLLLFLTTFKITQSQNADDIVTTCELTISASPCYCIPVHYAFDVQTEADMNAFYWDFGDGGFATGQSPVHEFAEPGEYKVCVTTITPGGDTCRTCITEKFEGAWPHMKPCSLHGTVVDYIGLDGCGLVIETDGGEVLEPVQIVPNVVLEDGMRIAFSYTELSDMGSICMVGKIVRLDCVEILEKPDPCGVDFSVGTFGTDDIPPSVLEYVFIDRSPGEVISWEWSFGDGETAAEKQVSHSYKEIGNYKVCLTVQKEDGCIGTACKEIFVGYVPTEGCQAYFHHFINDSIMYIRPEVPVNFVNESRGDIDWYHWDFGDGHTSQEKNPMHGFPADEKPEYKVCLTVGNDSLCKNTMCDIVNVRPHQPEECEAWFEFKTLRTWPPMFAFEDMSHGEIVSRKWDFGDGQKSVESNPVHQYENYDPGRSYEVCLHVTTEDGCESSVCRMVLPGQEPEECFSDFYFSNAMVSNPNLNQYKFFDYSRGYITEWYWEFGDGSESREQEPVHIYEEDGEYEVCLTVTSGDECKHKQCKLLSTKDSVLYPPPSPNDLNFKFLPLDGKPWAFSFHPHLHGQEVIEFEWNFGDGSISHEPEPVHVYEKPGVYDVCLTIHSVRGEIQTVCHVIDLHEGPPFGNCKARFRYDILESFPEIFAFRDLSKGEIDSWYWDFGDGNYSREKNPSHSYEIAPTDGQYDYEHEVCLTIITADSCIDTYCDIVSPQGGGQSGGNCDDLIINLAIQDESFPGACDGRASAKLIDMFGIEQDNVKFIWNEEQTGATITHLCSNTPYMLLATTDDGCMKKTGFMLFGTDNKPHDADDHQYMWKYEKQGDEYTFFLPEAGQGELFEWNFGDSILKIGQEVNHKFEDAGIYTVNLTVTDKDGNKTMYSREIEVNATTSVSKLEHKPFVYPNPALNHLYVQFPGAESSSYRMKIYTSTGKLIRDKKISSEMADGIHFDVSGLAQGFYFLHIFDENNAREVIKFAKR